MSIRLLFLFMIFTFGAVAQIKVNTQNENYPVISGLDSVKMTDIRNLQATMQEKEKMMRQYLQPFCDSNDALACYLLAITYDKFPIGMGTKADADTALSYYQKAADGKLADACYFLSQLYWYNFMNQPVNEKLCMYYLLQAKRYGNAHLQTRCLRDLAGIYYPQKEKNNQSDMKGIKASLDSAKYYLAEALKIEPDDTWTLDFAGSIYEDEKNYPQAISYYLRSSNENSNLQAANWLATGRKVKKDIPQAVRIVKQVLNKLVTENGYTPQTIYNFMGSYNPAVLLNIFYTCYKIIPKSEVGKWYSTAISCDDFEGLVNE